MFRITHSFLITRPKAYLFGNVKMATKILKYVTTTENLLIQ